MTMSLQRKVTVIAIAIGIAIAAFYLWQKLKPAGLPAAFVTGNGRIEGTEVDIATKFAGRVKEIRVREGDFVEQGQVVAVMDTQSQQADLEQLQAKVKQAQNASATAEAVASQKLQGKAAAAALVAQRRQAKTTALAVVKQSESEVTFAEGELKRSEELVAKKFITEQRLDSDRNRLQTAKASLEAAKSKVAEAQAAIEAAQSQMAEADAAIKASESQVLESKSSIDAAIAGTNKIATDIDDSTLKASIGGRVQYRTAEPGEVLAAGGKLLTILDVSDVYMTFFLPENIAGRVAMGTEARLVLDAAPQYVIPALVSYVDSTAQFTPKTVETTTERQKLVFRIKARIDPNLLMKYKTQVKTGLPGVAYVRLDNTSDWPANLQVKLPQ